MEPCRVCGRKHISHTETGAENRCNRKTQPSSVAVLWHPAKRHTHIKREAQKKRGLVYFVVLYFFSHFSNDSCEGMIGFVFDEDVVAFGA